MTPQIPFRTTCLAAALLAGLCLATTTAHGQPATQTGIAVYYSDYFQGRPTASGETFDQAGLTAAHNGYPFGTPVRVTNLSNDRSVIVTINDRMAADSQVLIDLTHRAAEELDFVQEGRTRVRLDVVDD